MGFYNIILEGQQAEEYKARKAKEAEKEEKEREDYINRRYMHRGNYGAEPSEVVGNKSYNTYKNGDYTRDANNQRDSDSDRSDKASEMVVKDIARRNNGKIIPKHVVSDDALKSYDAANRHIRRHPEKYNESNIFESVRFLNEDYDTNNAKIKQGIEDNKQALADLQKRRQQTMSAIADRHADLNKLLNDIRTSDYDESDYDETDRMLDDMDKAFAKLLS